MDKPGLIGTKVLVIWIKKLYNIFIIFCERVR